MDAVGLGVIGANVGGFNDVIVGGAVGLVVDAIDGKFNDVNVGAIYDGGNPIGLVAIDFGLIVVVFGVYISAI